MFPASDPAKGSDRDELLGRLWDALQQSGTLGTEEIEPEDLEVIAGLHNAEDVSPPDDEMILKMWVAIDIQTVVSNPATANGWSANPQQSSQRYLAEVAAPGSIPNTNAGRFRLGSKARPLIRGAAVAVAAGFLLGFVVLGGGGRAVMRLAAMMSADELQGATTENFETVGEMTLGGTLNLMITGGWFGIALAFGFMLIAPLLPRSGWRRIAASGLVFFAVCGFVTLEGGKNADYERFGIAGVNVCLFTLLPLIFGLLIGPVYTQLDRRIPRDPFTATSKKNVLVSIAMVVSLFPAFFGFVFLLILPPLQLFLVAPLLAFGGRWLGDHWGASQEHWSPWVRRVALAGPSIAGLTLTLVAIGRIV